ncbi:potassium channel protein [Thermatribacter velox]|uniref:Potassium channel protein n=1 Tax=Thermatribacter velox TaxID=3039681 RepID=A0ABZ2YH94_9BACT
MERQILYIIILAISVLVTGTAGYIIIEGWPLLDAFYMTVITLTTVGFGEVHPLSASGKLFTIFLVGSGVFVVTYSISFLVGLLAEGRAGEFLLRRRVRMELREIEGHFIVCGCGVVGSEVVEYFARTRESFVVIERDESKVKEVLKNYPELLFMVGDATREDVLKEAGIDRARGLLALLGSDADNVYTVITARFMNPHLRIVARAIQPESIEILRRAGADYVICPQKIGGLRLAAAALRPQVTSFLDLVLRSEAFDLSIEEVTIPENSPFAGKSLRELNLPGKIGLIVVAVKPVNRPTFEFNPRADTVIGEGDIIIVLGRLQQLAELRKMVTPE